MAILEPNIPEEKLVAALVNHYANNRGLEIYREVAFLNKRIDIVLLSSHTGEISAIEAKISWWRRVLHQARLNLLGADRVYVALLAKNKRPIPLEWQLVLKTYGIGFLEVVPLPKKSAVTERLHPSQSALKSPVREQELRNSIKEGFYSERVQ